MTRADSLSDIEIRPLEGQEEYRACVELQDRTWGAGFGEGVPPTILRLTQKLGGIASGAFDGNGRLLGFVFGLTGWVGGQSVHWSDMLAVHPDARGRGIGEALKRHQRELLIERNVLLARWTYDPLEARNARLNLSRLGGESTTYHPDYYGDGVSVLHAGIGTDRLIVDWHLDSERVGRRLEGRDPVPTPATLQSASLLNPLHIRSDMVDCKEPILDAEDLCLRLAVPADIQAMKRLDLGLARRWRTVTKQVFEAYFARGYRAVEFVRDGAFGCYLLER